MTPIITLTTDFGLADSYVASVKGVILSIAPSARIVDLSHQVPPQDILHGAYLLATAWRYFPRGTIHLAVVDPGVGTKRKAIAVSHKGHTFLAPDNGLLTLALGGALPPGAKAYEITNPRYRLKRISDVFHGRDIFAPAAAYCAQGLAIQGLGKHVSRIVTLSLASPRREKDGSVLGTVIHVDTFGNLITNVTQNHIKGDISIGVGGKAIVGLSKIYAEGGSLLALWGSSGYLEVAVRNGSAAKRLGVKRGDTVVLRPKKAG